MKATSFAAAAAMLVASSDAAALSPRQLGWGWTSCRTGNDAIDSLLSSQAIIQALCSSVLPFAPAKTVTVAVSSQVTVTNTITDTMLSPVAGTTKTAYTTQTGLTTQTVVVTQSAAATSTQAAPTQPTSTKPTTTSQAPSPPTSTSQAPSLPTSTSQAAPPTSASTTTSAAPAPPTAAVPSCDAVGYAGAVAAYHYDGSGLNGNFANCSASCLADTTCLSFGYGNNACLLYNVTDTNNVNLVAGSPYRFFNRDCPQPVVSRDLAELAGLEAIEKRQFGTGGSWGSIGGGLTGIFGAQLYAACTCLFGSSLGGGTVTQTIAQIGTVTVRTRTTVTVPQTIATTVTNTVQTVRTATAYTTTTVTGAAYTGGVGRA